MRRLTAPVAATLAALAVLAARVPAQAQTVADFYRGKSIEVLISSSAGGGYDAYSRMLARHMGRYIPGNPVLVPKNMAGGGGIRATNFLYNAAPKDGLSIAIINRGVPFEPLLGNKSAQFDATRLQWIGSTNDEVSICAAWHTTGVERYEQVLERELVVGGSGIGADTYQFPKIANGVLGTKFKIVTGYPGGNDIDLAMERQEVQGRCGWSWSSVKATHPTWLPEKKFNILFQMGLSKHPELPHTPLILDLAKSDEDRAILRLIFGRQVMAWPFATPPGVPQDRVDALRAAFDKTMRDKDFLAEAAKAKFEVRPVTGLHIQKLVQEAYTTPTSLVRKVVELLQ
jgi:tripartite-type tricarboxylate transporter receptor subunit TctC